MAGVGRKIKNIATSELGSGVLGAAGGVGLNVLHDKRKIKERLKKERIRRDNAKKKKVAKKKAKKKR